MKNDNEIIGRLRNPFMKDLVTVELAVIKIKSISAEARLISIYLESQEGQLLESTEDINGIACALGLQLHQVVNALNELNATEGM
jgi:hypothetical protein